MLIKIILLIILILINGIFSATEIAYLSLSKYELHKEMKKNNKKAYKIVELINDSSTFLSAIQIAITLSGFLASAFAAENFATELAAYITMPMISNETLTTILIIVITIILSYFTLVFGELIPKKIGLSASKKIAFSMVDIISIVIIFFKPFIFILKTSVDFFTKILGIKEKKSEDEENIKSTIIDSKLEDFEKKLLLNVFNFNDTTVNEVMTPYKEVIFLDYNISSFELAKRLKEHKYTRFPVLKNNKIIGFLNVKDLIIKNNKKQFKLEDYIRKLPKIESTMIIDDAFFYLRSNHEVMAEVTKDKVAIGIITIEDIIEEVVGNIVDEYNWRFYLARIYYF